MKRTNHPLLTALTLAALTAGSWAQTLTASNANPKNAAPASNSSAIPAATPAAASPAPSVVTAADVQALKDALAAQQLQIQRLTEQLERQQAWQEAQAAAAKQAVVPASVNPPQQVASLNPGMPAAAPVQQDAPATASQVTNPDAPQTMNAQMEGPITLHFRGINITPGGYVEGATVYRTRGLGADLPTPFNSVTMPGATQSDMPEFFGSGRQSKITTFAEGHLKNVSLSSYVSADFLSAGVTSTSTETNSYTLRLRQAWGQVKFNSGWAILAGQSWGLVTENGKGISPDDDLGRTNDSRPKTIDPSYNAGFVFTREYGLRLTKSIGDAVAVAVAIENPQATLTSHGNGTNFVLGETGASNSYNTTANYSFNPAPDLIAKAAFDPGIGHYEVFGILSRFTDRVFPCGEVGAKDTCGGQAAGVTSAIGAYNDSKSGGGFGASARWSLPGHFVLGIKGFGGSGVGRFAPGGLPDVSVNADGTLHIVKNLMGLGTIEWSHKKFSFNGYAGTEYAARAYSFDPLGNKGAGANVGYGAPTFNNTGCYSETVPGSGGFSPGSLANCTADTRALIEGTAVLWYRFYSGPRGSFRFGAQYSYVTRNAWSGNGGITPAGSPGLEPHGVENMIYTSFRYYLP